MVTRTRTQRGASRDDGRPGHTSPRGGYRCSPSCRVLDSESPSQCRPCTRPGEDAASAAERGAARSIRRKPHKMRVRMRDRERHLCTASWLCASVLALSATRWFGGEGAGGLRLRVSSIDSASAVRRGEQYKFFGTPPHNPSRSPRIRYKPPSQKPRSRHGTGHDGGSRR